MLDLWGGVGGVLCGHNSTLVHPPASRVFSVTLVTSASSLPWQRKG